MTASIGEQIMEAVATKFGGVGSSGAGTTGSGPGGATVFRSREAAVSLQEGIALVIRPIEETVTYLANTAAKRDLILETEILARGAVPDQVADAVRVPMHVALMADPTLGGLSLRIVEEATEWSYAEADQTAVAVKGRYKIIFLTRANTLTAAA